MRRTRKWSFVAQEAKRLADLGLSGYAIAKRLEVAESSVSRWVKSGKLVLRGGKGGELTEERAPVAADGARQTPKEWAVAVRAAYALDTTDDQLVTMAETALRDALGLGIAVSARLQAMGRFQSIVKQLALVARLDAVKPEPAPQKPRLRVVRSSVDPRRALMAVSE
jgi:predicted transcriptional regulator